MWPNLQENLDLVTFAEGMLNEKLDFLCSFWWNNLIHFSPMFPSYAPERIRKIKCFQCFQDIERDYCWKLIYGMLRLPISKMQISLSIWFLFICNVSHPWQLLLFSMSRITEVYIETSRYVSSTFSHNLSLLA